MTDLSDKLSHFGIHAASLPPTKDPLVLNLREVVQPFVDVEDANLEPLLDRIGDARVVLIGEATHGTGEFYRMRARITELLIQRKGFNIVGIEGDWPDVATLNAYVQGKTETSGIHDVFQRFPTWMWRNVVMNDFIEWLRAYNMESKQNAGIYGLDVYSMYESIASVLEYLEKNNPELVEIARKRYGCLLPYAEEPQEYGMAAMMGLKDCEEPVIKMLSDLLRLRLEEGSSEELMDAIQNARLVTDAEKYYKAMYGRDESSWNVRDTHMFETLHNLLAFRGASAKAVVWAHNSHLGNAAATSASMRGELNIGQLCKQEWGTNCYSIGFGTDHGTVSAASKWGGAMQIKTVRPSLPDSYEQLCHQVGIHNFFLPLRARSVPSDVREGLMQQRLERAIGVLYLPQTERQSHYFRCRLPSQFDEYIWMDETNALVPLTGPKNPRELADTYPSGL